MPNLNYATNQIKLVIQKKQLYLFNRLPANTAQWVRDDRGVRLWMEKLGVADQTEDVLESLREQQLILPYGGH